MSASESESGSSPWVVRGVLLLLIAAGIGVAVYFNQEPGATRTLPADIPSIDFSKMSPDVVDAIEGAIETVKEDPEGGRSWGQLGMVLYAHGLSAEAIESIKVAEQLDSSNRRWPYLHGLIISESDRVAGVEYLERAHQLAKHDVDIELRLAEFYLELQQLDKAEQHYDNVLGLDPNRARAAMGMARLMLARKDFPKALEYIQIVLLAKPKRREAHQVLAQIHRSMGNRAEAIAELEIIKSMPYVKPSWPDPILDEVVDLRQDPNSINKAAHRMISSGQIAEGIASLTKLIETDPGNPRRFSLLANQLIKANREDEASDVLSRGLAKHPGATNMLYLRGVIEKNGGKFEQAAKTLTGVVDSKPDFAEAHHILGTCQVKLQQDESAEVSFRNVLKFEPLFVPAHIELARILIRNEKADEAATLLKRALTIERGNKAARSMAEDMKTPK